jgi:quercetin 2,3-dioxygenase
MSDFLFERAPNSQAVDYLFLGSLAVRAQAHRLECGSRQMNPSVAPAQLTRIEHVGPYRLLMPSVYNREVISPSRPAAHSPFILMVEDRIGEVGEFGVHAHRGFVTVTFMLDGEMEHVESCNNMSAGRLATGDVQWMTAGRGIRHGGRPVGGRSVHSLQLWLNLPSAQKLTAAASSVQRSSDAALLAADGVIVKLYAGRFGDAMRPFQSAWPMTLMDIRLQRESEASISLDAGERAFVYVMEGEILLGKHAKRPVREGEVAWFEAHAVPAECIEFSGATAARLVYGAAQPIHEPVSTGAGFVMNTADEIDRAFAELRAGVF